MVVAGAVSIVSTYFLRGHVHTMDGNTKAGRRRRTYSTEFKTDLVSACKQPGVSIASLALANGMNANVLRRWLAEEQQASACVAKAGAMKSVDAHRGEPAFVPVKVDDIPIAPASEIRIEVRRAATTVTVAWPTTAAAECAGWMRELMK